MTRETAIYKLNWALDNNTIEDVQSAYEYIIALKMAIEALEQESCDDTITDIIEYINERGGRNLFKDDSEYDCIIDYIEALPPVQPVGRWIPVSERLPKPNQYDGSVAMYYLVQNEYGDMLVASYDSNGWRQIYHHDYLKDEVVAWMFLPKLYSLDDD